MNNDKIVALLDKTGNLPFYFGGVDVAYFWRATKYRGTIYAQRITFAEKKWHESFSSCSISNKSSKREIFDNVVLDFVVFHADIWQFGRGQNEGVFSDELAGPFDDGLRGILDALDETYASFLNRVMYWYGIVVETLPNYDGKRLIRHGGYSGKTNRAVKNVVDKLATNKPLVVMQGNSTFEWNLVEARGKIWYLKRTSRDYGGYALFSEEYGRVLKSDEDSYNALRDAIAGCLSLDGCEIKDDSNPDDLLCLVDLSLAKI